MEIESITIESSVTEEKTHHSSDMEIESITIENSDMELECITIEDSEMELKSIKMENLEHYPFYNEPTNISKIINMDRLNEICTRDQDVIDLDLSNKIQTINSIDSKKSFNANNENMAQTDNSHISSDGNYNLRIPNNITFKNNFCNSPRRDIIKNKKTLHVGKMETEVKQGNKDNRETRSNKIFNFELVSICPSLQSENSSSSRSKKYDGLQFDSDSSANSIVSILRFKDSKPNKWPTEHSQNKFNSVYEVKNLTKCIDADLANNLNIEGGSYLENVSLSSSEHSEKVLYEVKNTIVNEKLSEPNKSVPDIQNIKNVITDRIATFNVQNRYEYIIGAELMLKENLTLLCLQEPFDSKYKTNQSWISKKRNELNGARIRCIEHKHQVILIDNIKWGGKEICEENLCFQDGRVITLMFKFGQDFSNVQQIFGFISCYAVSGRGKSKSGIDKDKIRNVTKDIIQKTIKKWNNKYPGICIVILGDLQETVSIDDHDNWGNYRKPPSNDGIVKYLLNSHTSIVRDMSLDKPYWTRMGKDSHRGIDHIFIPQDDYFSKWFGESAAIMKDAGGAYFPSDHSLIFCSILRFDSDNMDVGEIITKYDYGEIFRIPLKKKIEPDKEMCELEFDNEKFRSKKVTDQLMLYNKIQDLTKKDSNCSGFFLGPIVQGTDRLWNDINDLGDAQGIDLKSNNLVIPKDSHFCKLEKYTKEFLSATHKVMKKLALDRHANVNLQAKQKRNHFKRVYHILLFGVFQPPPN